MDYVTTNHEGLFSKMRINFDESAIFTEAVVQWCSVKNVFLKTLQENTCARASFLIKLQDDACFCI